MDKEFEMKRNTYSEEKNKFEHEEEEIDYSGLDWEEAEIRPSKNNNEYNKSKTNQEKEAKKQTKHSHRPSSPKPRRSSSLHRHRLSPKSTKHEASRPLENSAKEIKDLKSYYHESDASEFSVHFYISGVYLSPSQRVGEFLVKVKDRVKKAGQAEYVQIAYYQGNEVKLSIGMKYDHDAIDILNRKRTIYLFNKDMKLYKTEPVVSKAFEIYCLAKNKELNMDVAKKGYDSRTNERSYAKKKRSSSSQSSKKSKSESPKKETNRKSSNLEKAFKKSVSKSSREDSYNKRKNLNLSKSFIARKKDAFSRSRSRSLEYEKTKKINSEKERGGSVKQNVASNFEPNSSGNMAENNSHTNLLNIAYLMNQQLVQNSQSFSIAPVNDYIYTPNPVFNHPPPEEKKEMPAVTENLEEEKPVTSGKSFTITNQENKKIINFNNRKQKEPAVPISDCTCLILGIPETYNFTDVMIAINQQNGEIEKSIKNEGGSDENVEKRIINTPSEVFWEDNGNINYLKLIFPNVKSAENLILNSLKIYHNSVIVLPFIPDKPLLQLLDHHEVKVISNMKVNERMIFQNFVNYGEIVNIIELSSHENNSEYVVIFSNHRSKHTLSPPCSLQIDGHDPIIFNVRNVDEIVPVCRPNIENTLNQRISLYNSYQKLDTKILKTEKQIVPAVRKESSSKRIIKKESMSKSRENERERGERRDYSKNRRKEESEEDRSVKKEKRRDSSASRDKQRRNKFGSHQYERRGGYKHFNPHYNREDNNAEYPRKNTRFFGRKRDDNDQNRNYHTRKNY